MSVKRTAVVVKATKVVSWDHQNSEAPTKQRSDISIASCSATFVGVRPFTVLFRLAITLALTGLVVGMITVLTGPQLKEIATSGEWSHSPVALASTGTRSLIYDQNGELMATFLMKTVHPSCLTSFHKRFATQFSQSKTPISTVTKVLILKRQQGL